MKIAFLSDTIYPYNKGGKETRSYELATQLSRRGHEVHFYTMKFWKGSQIIKQNGFFLHGICKNYPLYQGKGRSIKQGIMFGFASFKLLKEDFDVIDADHMVYFHLFPAKLATKLKGKKLIITWHEVWGKEYWKQYLGKKGIFGAWIEKLASKLPNKIIAVSEHTKNKLIKELKVNPKKIIVIPNGIKFEHMQKIKESKEKSDIIFAGRLMSHKNVGQLIKAVKIISKHNPKIKVTIVGDGPELTTLKKLAKELNLDKNIKFTGFIENTDDVYSLIKSSRVFVLPSTREGFGISLIEANALGVPVVTINHKDNAAKDLIQEAKNGFITELNENSLAEKIDKALKSSKSMKLSCINSAKKYAWDKIMSKFEEVYER